MAMKRSTKAAKPSKKAPGRAANATKRGTATAARVRAVKRGGYPSYTQLRKVLTPERLAFVKNDPARVAFVRKLAEEFTRDPAFMRAVETTLKKQR